MLFYEPFFLLFFFPLVYALYLGLTHRTAAKKWTLLLASVFFYVWGEPLFVPVLLASSLFDYGLSRVIVSEAVGPAGRRAALACGVVANLLLLVFYKYADFIAANLNLLLVPVSQARLPLLHIVLPIGVSFVVFEKITYLVDTYRRVSKPAPGFTDYALFVFFFPKLLAGPILKYHEMDRQIAAPADIGWDDARQGFLRFSRGIAKKLLLADPAGAYADQAFGAAPGALGAGTAWLGVICFTLQIYFDFSGYSDMAIGLARMLGFSLRENFNMPYASRTLSEFWRRWHISLTTWIRDYLYVPLGGNRHGPARTYLNLWISFLASGLWHGASWNFVLWGAYNGLILTLDRVFLARFLERAGALVAVPVTLGIVMFGWTIFRSPSLDHFSGFLGAMFGMSSGQVSTAASGELCAAIAVGTALSLAPATPVYPPLARAYEGSRALRALGGLALAILFVLACARAFAVPFKPFIYFRF